MAESSFQSEDSKALNQDEHNQDAHAKRIIIRAQNPDDGEFYNISAVDNGDGTFSLSTSSSGGSTSTKYVTRIDDTTTTDVTYIGKAVPTGSAIATSSSVWQITKIDESSGTVITYADGDLLFTHIWDDRTTETYA